MGVPLIKVKGLSFRYGTDGKKALDNVSLCIDKGEFVVIAGPSGCGKSTLCRCMNGLIPGAIGGHYEGEVIACGQKTNDRNASELSLHVGMVFQEPDNQLFSDTVESEIAFGPENLGLSRDEIDCRIQWALGITGSEHLRHRLIRELSGGEKQRVAVAAAMAMRPQVLVLDEPTSEIDPAGAASLIRTLKALNEKERLTIVLSEHRIERLLEAMGRLVVLDQGRIVHDGKPSDIFQNDIAGIGVFVPPLVRFTQRFHLPYARSLSELDTRGSWKANSVDGPGGHGDTAVSFRDVSYRYPSAGADAISEVTLDLYRGEVTAIMGANGSGKTTLIKHMNGLLRPYRGEVWIDGINIRDHTVAANARKVGLVFQNATCQLFEETVEKELAFGPVNIGLRGEEVSSRVREVARSLALDDVELSRSPLALSGGERQRVAIGGMLTLGQGAIALDEPTLGLDQGLKQKLAKILKALRADGKAVLVVTHDVEFAAACADRAILMAGGRIVADGAARDVLTSPLMDTASLHPPQASMIGRSLGVSRVLSVDELYRSDP